MADLNAPNAADDLKVEDVEDPTNVNAPGGGGGENVENEAAAAAAPGTRDDDDDDPLGAALLSAAEAATSNVGDDANRRDDASLTTPGSPTVDGNTMIGPDANDGTPGSPLGMTTPGSPNGDAAFNHGAASPSPLPTPVPVPVSPPASVGRRPNVFQRIAASLFGGGGDVGGSPMQTVVREAARKEGLELPMVPYGTVPGSPLDAPSPSIPPPRPPRDDVFIIGWNPRELSSRGATCVRVRRDTDLSAAVAKLRVDGYVARCKGGKPGARARGAILVVGGSDFMDEHLAERAKALEADESAEEPDASLNATNEIEYRLKTVFSRGIAVAAIAKSAAVVTAGVDKGPVGYMGRANADRNHQFPMIGVVPEGAVTWNGDLRPATDMRAPLQPDHTHVVMLECNGLDDAADYRFRVVDHLVRSVPGQASEHRLPAVAVCVSGDESDLDQALRCVRRRWPLIVIKGAGGVADAIAWAADPENRGTFVPNPAIMEIVADGNLEIVDLATADGAVMSATVERLFDTAASDHRLPKEKKTGPTKAKRPDRSLNCQLMWEQIKLYKHNALRMSTRDARLQTAMLCLNVFLATCVTVKMYSNSVEAPSRLRSSDAALSAFNFTVILLPICISLVIAVANYFQYGLKAAILNAAADYMLSQVYHFRVSGGNRAKNEQQLGHVLAHVSDAVVATQVGSMSLKECAGEAEENVRNALGMHAGDDAMGTLSPEQYIQFRLSTQLANVGGSTGELTRANAWLRFLMFLMVGASMALAIFDHSIFIALAVVLAATFAAIIERNNYVPRVVARNRCRQDLSRLKGWWHSLTPIEQTNPVKSSELVRRAEAAVMAEVRFGNPAAATLADASPVFANFDVDGLVGDISQSLTRGSRKPFVFASSWMDKYKPFFEAYHSWYAAKHQKRLKTYTRPSRAVVDAQGEDLLAGLSAARAVGTAPVTPNKASRRAAVKLENDDYGENGDVVRSLEDKQREENANALVLFDIASGDTGKELSLREQAAGVRSALEVSEILWDPDEFSLRTSRCVAVNAPVDADLVDRVHTALKLNEYLQKTTGVAGGVKGAIVIVGMSSRLDDFLKNGQDDGYALPDHISPQEGIARLQMVFARGVVAAARASRAAIVSSGVDVGPCALLGAANRRHGHVVPVIGVVSRNKTTWPGDEREGPERRMPVQPDHTHFVTLDTDESASCSRFAYELVNRVTDNRKHPSAAMLFNGGVNAKAAVLSAVREGMPIMVVRGTGGLADVLARAKADPDAFVSDNDIAEIVQDGHIEFLEISEIDGSGVNEMLMRLFGHSDQSSDKNRAGEGHSGPHSNKVVPYGLPADAQGVGFSSVVPGYAADPERGSRSMTGMGSVSGVEGRSMTRHLNNVIRSWSKAMSLLDKAGECRSASKWVKGWLLALGVLMSFVACLLHFVKEGVAEELLVSTSPAPPPPIATGNGVSLDTLNAYSKLPGALTSQSTREALSLSLLILPIILAIVTALDNELRYGMKVAMLNSSAEAIKSEIFKYRTCVGKYSTDFFARNAQLARTIDDIADGLMSTGVGELGGFAENAELDGSIVMAKVASAESTFATDDDFYSQLTPEDYVTHRLECLKTKYKKTAAHAETWAHRLTVPLYVLQGISMGLALVPRYQAFVAVSAGLTSAVVAVKEKLRYNDKLFVYNRSLAALTGILTWWRSLSAVEKANPQKFCKLVEDVEKIKRMEVQSLAPTSVGGGARGDTDGASEHFQPEQFKQDVVDNVDEDGQLQVKTSWIGRHAFFNAYQEWCDEHGMWEDRRVNADGELTTPPLEGDLAELPFLAANLVSLEPERRGHDLAQRWQTLRGENEKMTSLRWHDMGPKPPAPLGCRYVDSTGWSIERDPDWTLDDTKSFLKNSKRAE